MARFVYTYKTPDNQRHEGEIAARDRDAVFAALRAQGIRAIKVEPKGWETGKGYHVLTKRLAVVGFVCLALGGALALALAVSLSPPASPTSPASPSHSFFSLAAPLPRQPILGDRVRIENPPADLFSFALERHLARFAEPGRPLPVPPPGELRIPPEEIRACLDRPIRFASNEFTEYVDLKRIVAGMKREFAAYLEGGGTLTGYCADLVKRQNMEIACRAKAERHLAELLAAKAPEKTSKPSDLAPAYDFWLKANASLKAMGIHEIPLPDRLRSYQLSIGFDVD